MSAYTKKEVRQALKDAQKAGVKLPQIVEEIGVEIGKLRNFAGPSASWSDAEGIGALARWLERRGYLEGQGREGLDELSKADISEDDRLIRRGFIVELDYLSSRYKLPGIPLDETNSLLKLFAERVLKAFNKTKVGGTAERPVK